MKFFPLPAGQPAIILITEAETASKTHPEPSHDKFKAISGTSRQKAHPKKES